MSAVFTQHALERMRERDVTQGDAAQLVETVERVSSTPGELARSGEVVRVGPDRRDGAYIVRAGDMRAVVTVNPAVPGQVIVMSVYRSGQVGEPILGS